MMGLIAKALVSTSRTKRRKEDKSLDCEELDLSDQCNFEFISTSLSLFLKKNKLSTDFF